MSDDEKIVKKTWECPECKSCFVKYISMYTHCRQKHKPPMVDCAHCDEKFVTYAGRNSHYYRAMNGSEKSKPKRQKREHSSDSSDSSYEEGQTSSTDTQSD